MGSSLDACLSPDPSSKECTFEEGSSSDTFPAMQSIKRFAFDESISAKFYGRKETTCTRSVRLFLEFSTFGVAYLIERWFPSVEKGVGTDPCPFVEATHVFVVNSFKQPELVKVDRQRVAENVFHRFLEDCLKTDAKAALKGRITAERPREIMSLNYRCNRFILNPLTGCFISIHDLPRLLDNDVDVCEEGLRDNEFVLSQRIIFGTNQVKVITKSIWQLLVDEILHPFNVFQIFSIIVWSFENYYYYAFIIFIMTSGSVAVTLYETLQNQKKLGEMARFSCSVKVLRERRWRILSSEDLVPGDVVDLEDIEIVPCDLILLNGDAIVDESMLTGETTPLSKSAVSYDEFRELYACGQNGSVYSLYSGTRILRSRSRYNRPATALVWNTGYLTAKGCLIQSILFPRPNKFRFYRDSMIFVGFLGLVTVVGFIFSLIVMVRLGYDWYYIITRALDLITVVIPPALPATMSVGAIFALNRLKSKDIFCISPPRINVCAKVGVMCFDKTGTLTEEGLDVLGVVPVSFVDGQIQPLASTAPFLKLTPTVSLHCRPLVQLMATCHSIQKINEHLVGDPLDLKMFAFSNWIMEEAAEDANEAIVPMIIRPPGSESFDLEDAINASDSEDNEAESIVDLQEMGIIRCFEFNATIRRMSVVARELESERMLVMTKGSPESIKSICKSPSLPPDYDQVLARYSHSGYRVIGCAYKELPDGTSWLRVQRMKRDEDVEKDLHFLGFLLFENKLKEQTLPIIKSLSVAGIATVMVTGDNLYTAVAVARACGMIPSDSVVYVPVERDNDHGHDDDDDQGKLGLWESLDSGRICTSDVDLLPLFTKADAAECALAMSGSSFEQYLRAFPCEPLRAVISKCRVFARMSPQQKQFLVELLQSYGLTVGFCGDGANDCGALKVADVGLSLSAAEASVAAPFTSRQQHIGCVIELLREGRAALVTSFSCFKFMILYSMIQFTTLTLMYLFKTSLTDGQFIYIDLCLIIPFGILLSKFGPALTLHPKQPTARLISTPVLSSLIGQVILQFSVQLVVAILVASRFSFKNLTDKAPSTAGNINLFLSSIVLYSTAALIFSFGFPHRERLYLPFILFVVLTFSLAVCLCVFRASWLDWALSLRNMVPSDGWMVIALTGVHFLLSVLYEIRVVPWISMMAKRLNKKSLRVPV